MTLLSSLKEIIVHETFCCPKCDYEPDNPKTDFTMVDNRSSDFKEWECPECSETFHAVLCKCGRGYTSRSDFERVSLGNPEVYKCGCGQALHQKQRP